MAARKTIDQAAARAAVIAVADWARAADLSEPDRTGLAAAVRMSARTLAQIAPGSSVEVRVPPFVAVQCIEGPRHTRGTPPNVVECDPRTWLRMVIGELSFADAVKDGAVSASGSRAAEVASWMPLFPV
ncbi:hypothetical protein GII33_04730 [Gordonia pseudamarae]|uniref:Bacterial SCP orthologue domain-containing protein n=1 Tax=Gordonia pseudamarae TaxID=2831662 RepID=A0ABX6IER9_9ACTN|nr:MULTISPECIES: sterol carrier family protein [Gordonia]MBD0021637.1 hypothetical protein [Gordonia sp. (in: high G+C Gram-positive bacteria)]QHN25378.1 hypothetical protein GII33_04730 [Gordonia pseudamarae]QHN34309.1 hypothetical protein GII31_04725 [Gordonia pseudamarae]